MGLLVTLIAASCCFAQDWDVSGAVGYGAYHNGSVYAPAGTVKAGVRSRFAFSLAVSEDRFEHLSGELRYTYQDGDPFVEAGGQRVNVQGRSHAVHYDFLFHVFNPEATVRPFVAIGGGVKQYAVNSPEQPDQPLGDIAVLRKTVDYRPLLTAGFGVKLRLGRHLAARFDFRDYITPFPKKIISPVPLATARGLLHQFTPMIGLSYAF